jgi:hypothetical protein
MAEPGVIRRYAYWADRRIRNIASDNGIALERRVSWASTRSQAPGSRARSAATSAVSAPGSRAKHGPVSVRKPT